MEKNLLLMYFDSEDMKWYFGGISQWHGNFHWVEDMRHAEYFDSNQVVAIRESLKDSDNKDEAGFQVYQRIG